MATDEDPATTAEEKDLTLAVIAELEDKTTLEDIRDAKGHSDKTPAAVRHFNDFLVLYCQEKNSPIVTANDLPCHGLGDIGDYQNGGMTSLASSSTVSPSMHTSALTSPNLSSRVRQPPVMEAP